MARDTRDPDKTIDPNRPRDLARLDAETNRAIYMVAVVAVGSVVLMYVIEKIF